jgi:hypothetical protein
MLKATSRITSGGLRVFMNFPPGCMERMLVLDYSYGEVDDWRFARMRTERRESYPKIKTAICFACKILIILRSRVDNSCRRLRNLISSAYRPCHERCGARGRATAHEPGSGPTSCNANEEQRCHEEAVALDVVNTSYDSVFLRDKGALLRNSGTWRTSRNLRRSMPGRPVVSSLPAK